MSGENVAIEGNGDNDVKPSVIKEHVELKREFDNLFQPLKIR